MAKSDISATFNPGLLASICWYVYGISGGSWDSAGQGSGLYPKSRCHGLKGPQLALTSKGAGMTAVGGHFAEIQAIG